MRNVLRWSVILVITGHGLIHLLGAVKGFGWAEVPALEQPIGAALGLCWLAAAALMLLTAGLLVARVETWWTVAAAAVLASQAVIITSWSDAKVGTVVNVLLALAAVYGIASYGRASLRATFRRDVKAALEASRPSSGPVTEDDLERLPVPVADYLRRVGAVGQPRVTSFRATIHGRIRAGADQGWMSFTGEQVNTYGADPTRQFFIDATRSGLPVDVLHVFAAGHASMRVRLCSLLRLVKASGPDLDRAETVTVFNDLCVLAPAALVDAPVAWQTLGSRQARGAFTLGGRTVTAELTFDEDHELVDFVSDDRMAASADGTSFVARRWSTPISSYRDVGPRRIAVIGEAHWHLPAPDAEFSYLDFRVDDLRYNVEPGAAQATGAQRPAAVG